MMFLLCWLVMIIVWAAIVAAMGVKALIGFALGVIAIVATSLAVGLASAAVHHRRIDRRIQACRSLLEQLQSKAGEPEND